MNAYERLTVRCQQVMAENRELRQLLNTARAELRRVYAENRELQAQQTGDCGWTRDPHKLAALRDGI